MLPRIQPQTAAWHKGEVMLRAGRGSWTASLTAQSRALTPAMAVAEVLRMPKVR